MSDQELLDAVVAVMTVPKTRQERLDFQQELIDAIDAIEADPKPCLTDAVCSCPTCARYLQLYGDLQDAEDAIALAEDDL